MLGRNPAAVRNLPAADLGIADGRVAAAVAHQVEQSGAYIHSDLVFLGFVAIAAGQAATRPVGLVEIQAWNEFEDALAMLATHRPSAADTLRKLASANPDAPVMQTTYARALREAGRASDALAVYRSAARKWPTDATLLHDLAAAARDAAAGAKTAAAARSLRDEAVRAERAALTLQPDSAMALNGLGLLATDEGRPADAAPSFERAAALHDRAACAASGRDDFDAAEADGVAAVDATITDDLAAAGCNRVADRTAPRQELDAAAADNLGYIQRESRANYFFHFFNACIHAEQGNWRAAQQDLSSALELEPTALESRYLRSVVRLHT